MKYKKSIFILLVAMLVAMGMRAQYSDMYYHRVGDTIEWRAPNGYYSWWEFEYFYQNNMPITAGNIGDWAVYDIFDSAIMLQRFFTPVPLKIIGVAGAPSVNPGNYLYNQVCDTTGYQDYFYVYDATPTGLVRVAEAPWNMFDPYRVLHIRNHYHGGQNANQDTCCRYDPTEEFYKIYEYYFDTAIYVTDSFYVGGSLYNHPDTVRPAVGDPIPAYCSVFSHLWSGSCDVDSYYQRPNCRPRVERVIKKEKSSLLNIAWTDWVQVQPSLSYAALIYPIIEVDTTVPPEGSCVQVANLEVPIVDSGCAVVTWDDFPNYTRIYVQYGPIAVPPHQWTTVEVEDSTFCRICGFDNAGRYGVRVKAECDKVQTDWTEPVYFYSVGHNDNPSESVPTVLSANTFLMPNPARDMVVVSSSFSMKNIDIYSAHGILVYSEHPVSHRQEISLEGLPAGTYLVVIDTFGGTTHKKLVIK